MHTEQAENMYLITVGIEVQSKVSGRCTMYSTLNSPLLLINSIRSLSGKNWQDRDKADKVSILFPRDSKGQLKCFWGCNEKVRKIYHPRGGLLF